MIKRQGHCTDKSPIALHHPREFLGERRVGVPRGRKRRVRDDHHQRGHEREDGAKSDDDPGGHHPTKVDHRLQTRHNQ